MSPFAVIHGLRIGCVKYLNARPLIYACDEPVIFEHPANLADDLRDGRLDAGLIPVYEALRIPKLVAVDEVAIACRGPVYSVVLAHRGKLESHSVVSLDPASRTSAHLAQVLLAEFYGMKPRYQIEMEPSGEADARVLIGTQAIEFRSQHGATWSYLDLGEAWLRNTGLPFVFALWMLRADLPKLPAIAAAFRELKHRGIAAIPEIVAKETDEEFAARYLTQFIQFNIGDDEKRAIELFRQLLQKHGLLPGGGEPVCFV